MKVERIRKRMDEKKNKESMQWGIAGAMFIAWAITYAAIAGGVKSGIERAAKS